MCEGGAADMRMGGMRKHGKAVSLETCVTDSVTAASHFSDHLEETREEMVFEKAIHNSRQYVAGVACNLWLQGMAGGG